MSFERERVRKRLLELAAEDDIVVAAANTGSYVSGNGDEWSDIDLAFSIHGELAPALDRSDATEVAVSFTSVASGTAVAVERRGWERTRRGR